MSKTWKTLVAYNLCLFTAVILTVGLGNSFSSLPALGPLLSPFTGFWRNSPVRGKDVEKFDWSSLSAPVTVVWDKHSVPHVFGKTLQDVYQVQGFLHARDRLFQMELSTRPAFGRLSEMLGPKLEKYDRFFIKMGMRRSVEKTYEMVMADPEVRAAVESYTEGANRYIRSLSASRYPVEYKLLGQSPELWTAKKSVGLLKVMTFRLAGRSYDLMVTKHLQKLGRKKAMSLFPGKFPARWFAGYEAGRGYQKPEFRGSSTDEFTASFQMFPEYLQPFATNGSNNWAVSGRVTRDGQTYIANDTHLKYSTPNVWYEQQLVATDDNVNIYGAAFAGAPGLEIGIQPEFGWAVTNGNTDVADWFEVEFESESSLRYLWNGDWKTAEKVDEEFLVKGGSSESVELLYTEAGLVMAREGKLGLALRWMPHEGSNEFRAFLELVRSKDRKDCEKAIKHLWSPSQNVICADTENVAIYHAGRVPIRPSGDGQFVKNGRVSDTQWKGFVPFENIPKKVDPKQGYVFSANAPVASDKYPYFVTWDYNPPYRALRISEVLDKNAKDASIESFKALQTDDLDLSARETLPLMLELLGKEPLADQVVALKAWDHRTGAKSSEASLFFAWRSLFRRALFEPVLGPREGNLYPKNMIVTQILEAISKGSRHPALWILGESPKDKVKELLRDSLEQALAQLTDQYGDPKNWAWGEVQGTQIDHLIKLGPFGGDLTSMGGSVDSVNANGGNHGPSWRHIARLGEDFEVHVNYPGGQPGNPFDPDYRAFVKGWAEGSYREVNFYRGLEQALESLAPTEEVK
ncbi:MAG: penicillin acylase family protein [Bdellovibrionales bacterium]|nr:penicillin acylase family protein [Bdellovibrionales bacterium]